MFHLWSDFNPKVYNTHVLTGKFDLTNVNNMAFYISGPKLLFETTEISTHPNATQQESNYIYLYTTKFWTSIKIRLNRKFESTEFETMRVNCIWYCRFWLLQYSCNVWYFFSVLKQIYGNLYQVRWHLFPFPPHDLWHTKTYTYTQQTSLLRM